MPGRSPSGCGVVWRPRSRCEASSSYRARSMQPVTLGNETYQTDSRSRRGRQGRPGCSRRIHARCQVGTAASSPTSVKPWTKLSPPQRYRAIAPPTLLPTTSRAVVSVAPPLHPALLLPYSYGFLGPSLSTTWEKASRVTLYHSVVAALETAYRLSLITLLFSLQAQKNHETVRVTRIVG